jgi:hypothetical protein
VHRAAAPLPLALLPRPVAPDGLRQRGAAPAGDGAGDQRGAPQRERAAHHPRPVAGAGADELPAPPVHGERLRLRGADRQGRHAPAGGGQVPGQPAAVGRQLRGDQDGAADALPADRGRRRAARQAGPPQGPHPPRRSGGGGPDRAGARRCSPSRRPPRWRRSSPRCSASASTPRWSPTRRTSGRLHHPRGRDRGAGGHHPRRVRGRGCRRGAADATDAASIHLGVEADSAIAALGAAMAKMPAEALPLPREQIVSAVAARERQVPTYSGMASRCPTPASRGSPSRSCLPASEKGIRCEGRRRRRTWSSCAHAAGQPRVHQRLQSVIPPCCTRAST